MSGDFSPPVGNPWFGGQQQVNKVFFGQGDRERETHRNLSR